MSISYDRVRGSIQVTDAVIVTISAGDAAPIAEVSWPANAMTQGGDYFYPTTVELALARALDVREHYGFDRIVIRIDDLALWDRAWGELAGNW